MVPFLHLNSRILRKKSSSFSSTDCMGSTIQQIVVAIAVEFDDSKSRAQRPPPPPSTSQVWLSGNDEYPGPQINQFRRRRPATTPKHSTSPHHLVQSRAPTTEKLAVCRNFSSAFTNISRTLYSANAELGTLARSDGATRATQP